MIPGAVIAHIAHRNGYLVTDFSDGVIGNMNGNGWTLRGGSNITAVVEASSASLSGKRARIRKSITNDYRLMSWDKAGLLDDLEVLALIQIINDSAGANETVGQITLRADNAADVDPYYVFLPCRVSSVKKFEIGRGDGAGGGVRLGNVNKSWDTSNYWWIRARAIGNTQKGKMWQFGTAEPTTWENDFADTNVPNAGFVGLGMFYVGMEYTCLWFSIATGGKTAQAPGG